MLLLQAIFKLTINNYLLNPSSSPEKSIFNHQVSDPLPPLPPHLINFLLKNCFIFTEHNYKPRKPVEIFEIEYKTNCVMNSTMDLHKKQELNVLIGYRMFFATFNLY